MFQLLDFWLHREGNPRWDTEDPHNPLCIAPCLLLDACVPEACVKKQPWSWPPQRQIIIQPSHRLPLCIHAHTPVHIRLMYVSIAQVLNDLLDPSRANLKLREDPKRGFYVEGIKEETLVSAEHALSVIATGVAHRKV